MQTLLTDIDQYIPIMDDKDKVYELFRKLGYSTLSSDYEVSKETFNFSASENDLIDKIYIINNIDSYAKELGIYLIVEKKSSTGLHRSIPKKLFSNVKFPFVIFTNDFKNYTFVIIDAKRLEAGKYDYKTIKLVIDREDLKHTDAEILTKLIVPSKEYPSRDVIKLIKEAFSIEKVTRKFFDEYKRLFNSLKKHLKEKNLSIQDSHELALQILNRIMFLYFVQKKEWIGENKNFLKFFWQKYNIEKQASKVQEDSFYKQWLSVLFFEAFNNKFTPKRYLNEELNKILMLAPYLNGGLYIKNKLDELSFDIEDKKFIEIFNFFNRYNFTIKEDLPLEVTVAVDPEMIGKVYESLVNVSDEADEKQEAGIFYTDRTEIDFMCRQSLVEYFSNYIEDMPKHIFYNWVYAIESQDKDKADQIITKNHLWIKIEGLLDDLSIIDPACGSGSFLVGMLIILKDLYKRVYKNLYPDSLLNDFDISKKIIGQSLYGVDVMRWAIHIAELRLWLQLIVNADLTIGELKVQPLLPNLTFKLRSGDAIVQEIEGIDLAVRKGSNEIPPQIKREITNLKNEKFKFYNNDHQCKFKSEESLKNQERNIFIKLLQSKFEFTQKLIKDLEAKQLDLFEKVAPKSNSDKENELAKLKNDIEKLEQAKKLLTRKELKPFVWDIDFVEIFQDENENGFDIVIGNPPYVRQELIKPPLEKNPEVKAKQEYKTKLEKSIQLAFGKKLGKIDKKSDLYIYFYLYGLSLLNNKGTLCFITSNSWLDVGYGDFFQEFLLKNIHIKAIYDNSAKRSFKTADVNTVIAVLGSPVNNNGNALNKTAKFVLFKKPFEEAINVNNLIEIEQANNKVITNNIRVFPVLQKTLLEEGRENGKYVTGKWKSRYIQQPDFLIDLFDKKAKIFIDFPKLVNYNYGVKTGSVKFFYLSEETIYKFKIEKDFLIPMITTSKLLKNINIDNYQYIFNCHLPIDKLKGTGALKYIEWGEAQKLNTGPSVKSNKPYWYSIQGEYIDFILFRFWDKRFFVPCSSFNLLASDNFFYGKFKQDGDIGKALLNSTFFFLQIELLGRTNQGEGILNTYGPDFKWIKLIDLNLFKKTKIIEKFNLLKNRNVKTIFEECGINQAKEIRDNHNNPLQTPKPMQDRKELDDIIFDVLDLSEEERKEVYITLCETVKKRLDKAESFKKTSSVEKTRGIWKDLPEDFLEEEV